MPASVGTTLRRPKTAWKLRVHFFMARVRGLLLKSLKSLAIVVIVVVIVALVLLSPLAICWVAGKMDYSVATGLEVARLVYSWPTVVGVSVVLALGLFRTPLAGLIERVELFKGGPVEFRAPVPDSIDSKAHRDLLGRIEVWLDQEDHWGVLSSWAERKGESSATVWLNSAGIPELQELVEAKRIS